MSSSETHCHFYLKKKKRYCRFTPKPNATYCPEHACVMGIVEDRKRISCPLNPNHNCYEDELQKHLKKCNVTKRRQAIEKLPFYVKDVNKGARDDYKTDAVSTLGSVKDLTSERLGAMIEKVHQLYSDVVEDIEKLHLEHPHIKEEILGNLNEDLTRAFGDQAVLRKEMLQQASLVGQLENLGFLSSGCHYVELGAGKGKLSHWIHKAIRECVDNSFLLVERSSVRYKVDPYHKGDKEKEGDFQRIKIDIQDFCLGKVPGIQNKESVVVVGKHLCGGATDLGIRCAVNTLHPCLSTDSPHQQNPPETVSPSGVSPQSRIIKLSDTNGSKSLEQEAVTTQNKKATVKGDSLKTDESQNSEKGIEEPTDSPLKKNPPDTVSSHSATQETSFSKPSNANENRCSKHEAVSVKKEEAAGKRDYSKIETSQNSEQRMKYCSGNVGNSENQSGKELNREPPSKIARRQEEGEGKRKCKLQGIMIALCCHHRCTWDTYVGQEFMRRHGVNEEEFDLLTRLSSWATCARTRIRGKTSTKKSADVEEINDKDDDVNVSIAGDGSGQMEGKNRDKEEDEEHSVKDLIGAAMGDGIHLREMLSVVEREKIGRKAKRIIDTGRLEYLQSKNMNCCLREYIRDDFTPENVVLVATACEET